MAFRNIKRNIQALWEHSKIQGFAIFIPAKDCFLSVLDSGSLYQMQGWWDFMGDMARWYYDEYASIWYVIILNDWFLNCLAVAKECESVKNGSLWE